MLVFTDVPVEEIAAQGRQFKWKRPSCPAGCPKLWGHGFVVRFLTDTIGGVLLRRYRCPTCKVVITLVPDGFCRRYQTAGLAMAAAIRARLSHRGWPRGVPRQRGGHWLRRFLDICRMDHPGDDPLTVLGRLVADGCHFLV